MNILCPRCDSPRIEITHHGRKAGGTVGAVAGTASGVADAAAGAEAGAALGVVGGPIGIALGGLAGAILGGLVGGVAGGTAGATIGSQLDGVVFDQTTGSATAKFRLGDLIQGWQIAIPLLQKGGKGTFFCPSDLGYGPQAVGNIPSNSVLIFEIELVDF